MSIFQSAILQEGIYNGSAFLNQYAMYFSAIPTNYLYSAYINDDIQTLIRSGNPAFSVSVWIKLDNTLTKNGANNWEPTIFSLWNDQSGFDRTFKMIIWSGGGTFYVNGQYNDAGATTTVNLSASTFLTTNWTNLIFTYDSTQTTKQNIARIYTNGIYDSANSSTANTATAAGQKLFGQNPAVGADRKAPSTFGCIHHFSSFSSTTYAALPISGSSFSGTIDECSFWYGALTQAQITELYNNGKPGYLSIHSNYGNLLSWYRMGDGDSFISSGWTINDNRGTVNLSSQSMSATNRVTTTL